MRPVSLPESLRESMPDSLLDSAYTMRSTRSLLLAVAALLMLDCIPAQAQMQIPNPLIRPRGIGNQNAAPGAGPQQGSQSNPQGASQSNGLSNGQSNGQPSPPNPPPSAAPASYAGAVPLPGTVLPTDDPFDRNLTELTNRFANFYVSAIVGKQAMLRRTAAPGATPTGTAPSGLTIAPLPGAAPVSQPRSDSMTLMDGELLASVSKNGALMVKVSNSNVVITYAQETMSLPGGRLVGRRATVFTGGVESSGATVSMPIVLERMDPAYKRMITVETKTRSASVSGTTDTPASTTPPPTGGLPPP